MSDYRSTLERELGRLSPPRIPFDQLTRRRDRKHRGQRIRAGLLGLAIVLVMGWLSLSAIRSAPPVPIDDPTPTGLGIFADVRGWMVYGDVSKYFNDRSGIWAVDPANPDERPVLLSPNAGIPVAWSSDGSKLLINRGASYPPAGRLVVLNSDGSETQVAHADWITGGSFSPDGSEVIFGATLPGQRKSGIYVVDAEGGTPELLYAAAFRRLAREAYPPAADGHRTAVYSPALSPDGSRIAYIEGMGDWGNSLWVMNADGTDRHRIIAWEEGNELVSTGSLQWSPDGTRLAFEGGGINVVNADGSALTLVARGRERAPYWSPDGSRIAFQRDRAFYTMAPDGSEVQSLGYELEPNNLIGPWNPLDPLG